MYNFKPTRKRDPKLLEATRKKSCIICNNPSEGHHIITRGAGGGDDEWNILPLCRREHQQVHAIGLKEFAIRWPSVRMWLKRNGWQFDEYSGKWRHD